MSIAPGVILLFFSGAIAFVPERRNSNRVEAFLVNLPQHSQLLSVPLGSIKECPVSADGEYKCENDGAFCVCPLEDDVVVSIPEQKVSSLRLPNEPPDILPDGRTVGDIGWLVSMSHVKPNAARVVRGNVDAAVGGQISFNWTDAATCRFEEALCTVKGKESRRIFAVRFDVAIVRNPRQAVAELVVFKTEVPSENAKIELKRDEELLVTLDLLCPAEPGCPVLIANLMEGTDDTPSLCDERCGESKAEGIHFREYRRLANDVFGVAPNRLCGESEHKDLPTNTVPELCQADMVELKSWIDAVSNRIICPSVSLVP